MDRDIDRNVDAATANYEDNKQESTLETAKNPLRMPSLPADEAGAAAQHRALQNQPI